MRVKAVLRTARGVLAAATMALAVLAALPLQAAGEATPLAADAELEARVQKLSHQLRCLVCQNETIAESRAPLAIDLRNQVREQLAAGKSEGEVKDFLVARYGDFVLYKPRFTATTVLLWLGPGVLGLGAITWLLLRLRRRAHDAESPILSDDEHAQARALLGEDTPDSSQEPRQ